MNRPFASTLRGPAFAGSRPVLFGILALGLLVPAASHAFTGITLTPGDDATQALSAHEIRLTTEQSFDSGDRLEIRYPAGFDLSGVTLGPLTGLSGAFHTLNVIGQTVVLTRTGFSAGPGVKSVVLNDVRNPATVGNYQVTLEILASDDSTVEGPTDSSPFAITDALPDHLELVASVSSVTAGVELSLRVRALDGGGAPRPPGSSQSLSLISSSPSGSFHATPGGPQISSSVLPADSTGLDLWYRDSSIASSPSDLTVLDVSGSAPDLGFAQTSVTILPGAVDAGQSTVSAGTPVIADGVDASDIVLNLRDVFGNPVAGVDSAQIELSIPAPDHAVDELAAASAADGSFAARVRTLEAGGQLLSTAIGGVALDSRPTIQFTLRPVDAAQSSLVAGPDAPADGASTVDLDLLLLDTMGRPVAGVDSSQIVFTVLDGPGILEKTGDASDASGAFTASLRSTVAGMRRVTARVGAVDLADTVQLSLLTGPVDAARSSVFHDGSATADGSDFITAGIVLRDAFDNPIAGLDSASIALAIADATIEKTSGATGAGGAFVARLRSTIAGERSLFVTAAGILLDDTPLASFTAGSIDSSRTTLAAGPAAVADGVDAVALDLTLRDAYDNPVAGVDSSRISFSLDPNWVLTKLDAGSDATGGFRAELRSTTAGSGTTRAWLDGIGVGGGVGVDFVAGGVSAARSLVGVDGPAAADGVDPVLATIFLRDAQDNPIAGLDSSRIALGILDASVLELDAATGIDGSFHAELRSTVAGSRPLSVVVDGVGIDAQPLGEFTVGAIDPSRSSLAAVPLSQVADGVQFIALELVLRDAFDNPVAGVDSARVRFEGHPSWQVQELDAVSDASGRFTAELRSTIAVASTLEARVDGTPVASPLALEFVAGALDHFALALPDGAQVPAGQPARLEVTAQDALGNRMLGYAGSVHLSSTTGGSGANLSWSGGGAGALIPQPNGEADYGFAPADSGRAEFFVTDTLAESLQLEIRDGGVADAIGLQIDPAAPSRLELISGDGQNALVGTIVPAPLELRVLDDFDNPVVGVDIDFSTGDGGRIDTDPGTPGDQASIASDASGVARCPVWELGLVAGSQTATASAVFGSSVDFTANALAGPVASLDLEPTGMQTLEVGTGLLVAARAQDLYGNPVEGFELTLFVSDPLDGTLSGVGETDSLGIAQQRGLTASDGRVHVLYRAPDVSGLRDVLDATASGYPAGMVDDLVLDSIEGAAAAIQLELPTTPLRAGAEGSFVVELVDALGNPAASSSATVELRADASTGIEFSATGGGPFTNALDLTVSGSSSVYYRGGPAGVHDIRADDALAVLAADAGQLEIIADTTIARFRLTHPPSALAGAGFALSVEAFDAWDNPAVDATADFDLDLVSAADTTVAAAVPLAISAGSLSAGRFDTAAQRIELAGEYYLRLSYAGRGTLGPTSLRIDPASAWELVAASPDTLLGVTAGAAVDFDVEARDAYGNPVAAEALALLLLEGGTIESAPPSTDAAGRARFRLRTASTVGTARLRVGILDANPISRETVLFVAETVPGPVVSLSVEPAGTALAAGDLLDLTVRGYDAGGNLALGAGDAVELDGLGSAAVISPSAGNLLNGVLQAVVRDTLAESFVIEAHLSAAPAVSALSDSVHVSAAAAARILAEGALDADAPAGGRSTLVSRVEDRFGNAVAGELVRLALVAAPPGASIEDPDVPIDDGLARTGLDGRLAFDLLLSAQAGNHRVRAGILDADPPDEETVEWNRNGLPGAPDHLVLNLSSSQLSAGVSVPLELRLEDAADNLVQLDAQIVLLFTPSGPTTVPDPVLLSGGLATVDLIAFQAGSLDIDAALANMPSVGGSLSGLTVDPNLPAGSIPVPVVDPNPNTANGLAVTLLQAGPIVDAWGNVVLPGTVVDVFTDGGAWISEDMDPTRGGLQRLSDAAGRVEARLASPTSPATVTVDLSAGSAVGQTTIEFLAPASLVLDGPAIPSSAYPGQSLAFQVPVRNQGGVDVQLSAALSEISVDDGQGVEYRAALGADTVVPAGSSATLDFLDTPLPTDFAPGSHRPSLSLTGLDLHDQAVSAFLVLPQGALEVGALALRSVQHELQAIVGDTVNVRVEVENLGGGPVELTELALTSSPSGDFVFVDRDPLPTLGPGALQSILTRYRVGPATLVGSYRFHARVTGRVGSAEFSAPEDSSSAPLVIGTSSRLELVAGSVTPARIHHGADLALRVDLHNTGGTTVDLDTGNSVASLAAGAWSAALAAPVSLPPDGTSTLVFVATTVPTLLNGLLDLELHLEGLEAGRPVEADLLAVDAITVETPASIALEPDPLTPSLALRGSAHAFRLRLLNSGQARVVLDPLATRLLMGEPGARRLSVPLDASASIELPAGSSELSFLELRLPSDLQLADPVGFVELRGSQNGESFSLDLALPATAFSVQDPAGLRILATEALHPRAPSPEVNAGQRIPVRVVVGNLGGDAVDSLRVRLVGEADPPSLAPELLRLRLAAGASDTLYFGVDLTTHLGPEVLRAEIVRALSALTGEVLTPEPPIDDVASLDVQRPVALRFAAEWVESADPDTIRVSPDQVFELRAAIERVPPLDSQGDWLGVDLALDGLGGFTLEPGTPDPVHLDPLAPEVVLRLRAPPVTESIDLDLSLLRTDLDLNDPDAEPLQGAAWHRLRAEVNGGLAFDLCELQMLAPQGALDGVVSTGQSFVVEGSLDGPSNLQERELELLLPPELALVGGSARQQLQPGVSTVSWQLQCGAQPSPGLVLRMVAHAVDVQSSQVHADTCSSLGLEIVVAAEARARLSVLAPSTARDRGELAPGAIVELEGSFALAGDASAQGSSQLRLELPNGFTILDGLGEIQTLASPDQSVQWRVQGPSQLDLGVQILRLHTESPPTDENSGSAAIGAGESDAVALSILSDPLRLQLSDLDTDGNLISSDRVYDRARLVVLNGHGEISRLTVFEMRVVDDRGVDHPDPSAFLQSVQLRRVDGSGSWTLPVSSNPVRFLLDSAVADDSSAEFLIGAQARENAFGVSFAFRVESATASVLDPRDFPLSYTLLDGSGIGRSAVTVGASVTSSADPTVATHSYPNPFVPSREVAVLSYQLAQEGPVEIEIFDLLGERVRHWSFQPGEPQTNAGLHDGDVTWDGRNGRGESVRNGVYLCRFRAEGREILFRIAVTR